MLISKPSLKVHNRFQALVEINERENNEEEVNKIWGNIVTAHSESSKACLGYRQQKPKE